MRCPKERPVHPKIESLLTKMLLCDQEQRASFPDVFEELKTLKDVFIDKEMALKEIREEEESEEVNIGEEKKNEEEKNIHIPTVEHLNSKSITYLNSSQPEKGASENEKEQNPQIIKARDFFSKEYEIAEYFRTTIQELGYLEQFILLKTHGFTKVKY